LNACAPEIFGKFVQAYGQWLDANSDIFIGCLSEHDPNDDQGRLSMWRAYGSNAGGVCFVFNSTPFVSETDLLGAYSIPVSYHNDDAFKTVLDKIQADLLLIIEDLKKVDPDQIAQVLTILFVFKAIALKHPGFSEEQEWRILLLPDWKKGPAIIEEVVTVGGIPQLVYKIPLKNEPDKGLVGADIPNLISKVIIGPSDQPYVVWDAYVNLLNSLGVENAHEKVVISGIPLRLTR
jgi:hypothetical protein